MIMIAELTDREILEFLMTSDFNEKLSPDEAKFLLLKFRYFYRFVSSKNELITNQNEFMTKEIEEIRSNMNRDISELKLDNKNLSNKIDKIVNRKLTLRERFSGKIDNEL